jgi:hypothetical protein
MVSITTPEGRGLYTYHQLGMAHKQKPNQPKGYWGLLIEFAKGNGSITQVKDQSKFADWKRRLDKHLQRLFGISESLYAGHAKKWKGHKTRISFHSEVYSPTIGVRGVGTMTSAEAAEEREDIEDAWIAGIDSKRHD